MRNPKISLWTAAILAAFSLEAAPSLGEGSAVVDQADTVAVPNDGRFLYDQIDLDVYIDALGLAPIPVSVRPGQFLFVSVPVKGRESELVRKYAFLFHPEVLGEPAFDYEKISKVSDSDLKFVLVPHCLREKTTPTSATPTSVVGLSTNDSEGQQCRPRLRWGSIEDLVEVRFENRQTGISQGERRLEGFSGIAFVVKSYRRKSFVEFQRFGPTAKCCVADDTVGVEICACKIKAPFDSCSAGCR